MKVILTSPAEADLDEAAAFYEDQAAGLGDEVLAFLRFRVDELKQFAGTHLQKGSTYLCVTRGRFPYYVIYYRIKGDTVVVEAIIDHRRDPKWIRRTLRDRS